MSITVDAVLDAARELTTGRAPSVKLALWAVALSASESLEKNGALVALLRPYATRPLPEDREALFSHLKQARGFLTTVKIGALYYVEHLERDGVLNGLENIGIGYVEQCLWREKVYSLLMGKGFAFKTISFAALLIDPLHCELCPVDRWVMKRLYGLEKSPSVYSKYLQVEHDVKNERDSAGFSEIPLGLWHWLKWDEIRETESQAYKGGGGVESHAALSCRVY